MGNEPFASEQIDGREHVVEVVRGLAHAHEHDLAHAAQRSRQRHLGHDFRASEVSLQTIASGHAERTTDRTAHLRRNAQALFGQQHAFDGLAIGELEEQALGAVLGRVARAQAGKAAELVRDSGQRIAQRTRQERLGRARSRVERERPGPRPQHQPRVARLGAERRKALVHVFESHGRVFGGRPDRRRSRERATAGVRAR